MLIEVKEFFVVLRKLKVQGKIIIFISYKFNEVMEIMDCVIVIRKGKVIGIVKMSEVIFQFLVRMMVGRDVVFRI